MEVVEWSKAIATTEQYQNILCLSQAGKTNHELQVWCFNGCLAAAIPNGGIWFAQVFDPIYGHGGKKKKKVHLMMKYQKLNSYVNVFIVNVGMCV